MSAGGMLRCVNDTGWASLNSALPMDFSPTPLARATFIGIYLPSASPIRNSRVRSTGAAC